MKNFKDLREKKLTPAELKKREEIAKAMERDNPGMPMAKKMAIATATAKRVAEESDDRDELTKKLFPKKSPKEMEKADKERNRKMNQKRFMKPGKPSRSREWGVYEEVELEEGLGHISAIQNMMAKEREAQAAKKKKANSDNKKDQKNMSIKVKEAKEDDEPASPDEASMALKQLEFIEYAAEEMMDHIKSGKAFPEWFQNKLSKAHGEIEGLHSAMGEHGGDEDEEDMKEAYRVHAVSKDGEKMKSGLHPTKKAASDMHYKMAKSGMYKKIEVVKETVELDEAYKFGKHIEDHNGHPIRKYKNEYLVYAPGHHYIHTSADTLAKARAYAADQKPPAKPKTKAQQDHDDWRDEQKRRISSGEVRKAVILHRRGVKEEVQIDEVLDTPKAMDSYRNKAKYSKDRAANSAAAKMLRNPNGFKSTDTSDELHTMDKRAKGLKMADKAAARKTRAMLTKKEEVELDEAKRKGAPKMQGDFLKKERERNRAHDAAMGRTPTGRKKPVRTMTSTQRSLAKLRNETVMSADKKPEKYVKPDGKVGIRMVRTDKKVVSKDV